MSDLILWHNPRCSKSRQALDLLRARGLDPMIVLYLADARDEKQLRDAQAQLGLAAIDMMRRKEKRFAELGLSADSSEDTLITAMAENPVLIERPILFRGGKAVIGRPTEAILTLL